MIRAVDDTVFSEDGGPCQKDFGSSLHCMESLIGQKWCKQTNEFCKQTNDYRNCRKTETKTQTKQTTEGKENERNETTHEPITTTPEDPCMVFYLPHLP